MLNTSDIKLTVIFTDPSLSDEEKDGEVQKLLAQMKDLDEIEKVTRVRDPHPPVGNMAGGGFLVGLLNAEVNAENIKKVFRFLHERFIGKVIELEVEANGRRLKVKASSQTELLAAIEAAEKFIDPK